MIVNALCIAFGLLGFAFAAKFYLELWRWAKQCQNARIAIAYKQRVQIQAPLVEWLQWANQLSKDHASRGRVIYRNAKVSVAILRPADAPRFPRLRKWWKRTPDATTDSTSGVEVPGKSVPNGKGTRTGTPPQRMAAGSSSSSTSRGT